MDELERHGYIHYKQIIDHNTIDELVRSITHTRMNLPNYGSEDKHTNSGNRIGRLHLKLPEYFKCLDYIKEDVHKILHKPLIMGSLTFENGSSQTQHIDSWFFYTKPEKDMIGVWIALEDVEDDAGPLFYYEDSHLLKCTDPSVFDCPPENRGAKLTEDLIEKTNSLKRKNVNVKKGDIFVWSYNLVHGGANILNTNKTRNSIVFHLIDEDAELYTFDDYMKYGKSVDPSLKLDVPVIEKHGWRYQDFGVIEYVQKDGLFNGQINSEAI